MRSLSHLPQEILSIIVKFAAADSHGYRTLLNICLLDRLFYSIGLTVLYSHWAYYGDEHTLASLWRFVRTVISNPKLASLVRSLDVQYWGNPGEAAIRNAFEVSQEDVGLFQQACQKSGFPISEQNIRKLLQKPDRRPFVALLLTQLPNVSVMHANMPGFHEKYLGSVFEQASWSSSERGYMKAFAKLKVLYVWSEWASPDWDSVRVPNNHYRLRLSHPDTIFGLPLLDRLCLFDIDTSEMHCRESTAGTSSVRHLTLVHGQDTRAGPAQTRTILALPKALQSLSLYYYDQGSRSSGPGWAGDNGVQHTTPTGSSSPDAQSTVSNAAIYNALLVHSKSLEHVDIYRECSRSVHEEQQGTRSYFGSFLEFTSLRSMCISPEALLPCSSDASMAPLSLRDLLPPSLTKLTFYGNEKMYASIRLKTQIEGLLLSQNHPKLKTIVLESEPSFDNVSSTNTSHPDINKACLKANVSLLELASHDLSKGGKHDANFMKVKGQRRWRETRRKVYRESARRG
ncbi:hypothetical protein QQS21_006416 [Conoideocrella luteorostrata]|uniref:F-box domain-containing protein n=1 Tax=Conoideocrella luteorostrata TaxID=1105319 RepID=A0AAJ0FSX7_9HYPO|nr:hypothetical protein QQS21_006416 [Conoideocrella luteorostrata]